MGVIRWLLIMVVLVFLITFGWQNSDDVTVKYYGWQVVDPVSGTPVPPGQAGGERVLSTVSREIPLFFLALICVVAGAVVAGLIGLADQIRLRSRLRKQRKQIEKLEGEVKSLRHLPLEEEPEETLRS